jgi:hypothetical protein
MPTQIAPQAGEPNKKSAPGRKMSLFGQSIPFVQAFPVLASMKTTIWTRPFGSLEQNPQERHYALRNPPGEHVQCPKKGCTNGGWAIGHIMREMIAKRETYRKIEGKCNGRQWVVGPKYRDCVTHFTAEIELAYKPAAAKVAAK